jgi:hypothetical protein
MVRNSGEAKDEVDVTNDKLTPHFIGKSTEYAWFQPFNETKAIIRATVWRASPFCTQTINPVHE